MGYHKTVAWALVSAATLVAVSLAVEAPVLRATLSIFAVSPLVYLALRIVIAAKRIKEKREFLKLRQLTDDFLNNVRNLNRLKVIAQSENDLAEAEHMVDQVVVKMHELVEQIRQVAGQTSRAAREAALHGDSRQAHPSGSARAKASVTPLESS
jgi:hypothetical protein